MKNSVRNILLCFEIFNYQKTPEAGNWNLCFSKCYILKMFQTVKKINIDLFLLNLACSLTFENS